MVKRNKISGESPLYVGKKQKEGQFEEIPMDESKNVKEFGEESKKSQSMASFKISHKISPLKGEK